MHLWKNVVVGFLLALLSNVAFAELTEKTRRMIASAIVKNSGDLQTDEYVPDASEFSPEAQADLVTELPGLRILGKRRMFSGYIPVEGQGRGALNSIKYLGI